MEHVLLKSPSQARENGLVQEKGTQTQLAQANALHSTSSQADCLEPAVSAEIMEKIITGCEVTADGENLAAMCLLLTKQLAGQQVKPLDEGQLWHYLVWLQSIIEKEVGANAEALQCLRALMLEYPGSARRYWEQLFSLKNSTLLTRCGLVLPSTDVVNCQEAVVPLVMCLDTVFGELLETELDEHHIAFIHLVADALLRLHYNNDWNSLSPSWDATQIVLFLLHSLQLLQKIATLSISYAQTHVSALFGLAKEYIKFGISNRVTPTRPRKVPMSQQTLYDSSSDMEPEQRRISGGKIAKIRKPRGVVKASRRQHQLEINIAMDEYLPVDDWLVLDYDKHITTSESELSSSDTENLTQPKASQFQRRQRFSTVRIAAITLLATIARQQERRTLYGYWHSLFPGTELDDTLRDDLLYVGYSDPSVHCRSLALQVAAQTLYGSKQFLNKAEIDNRGYVGSFMPFAVSLGKSMRVMYRTLSIILASESALPVLTQSLKCLAVLIQATSFEQLNMGVVCEFMPYVKKLTTARDSTLQVSALMVLEFLISTPVLTEEIACLVGLPASAAAQFKSAKSAIPNEVSELQDELIEIDKEYEETLDSEEEQDSKDEVRHSQTAVHSQHRLRAPRTSWLLKRVLDNLDYDERNLRTTPTPVRIASLQVLSAMSKHFALFEDQLPRVARALKHSLENSLPDVRLYAGRCLDTLAYQLSCFVLETAVQAKQSSDSGIDHLSDYIQFWATMLPFIYATFLDARQQDLPALKICLCDAISNMGATIYERLSRAHQTSIIGFLSGCSSEESEDTGVRAASVRALAVFVLFPSLKTDLVFVENIAELSLRIISDTNVQVRIKAHWSMGNISDALIRQATSTTPSTNSEQISKDLLHRMITSSINACSDNDKIRSNAVRTLGNLLRMISETHLDAIDNRKLVQAAIGKLIDCIKTKSNAKVKWNTCYAISNLIRNRGIFTATEKHKDLNWQSSLYPALCQLIVRHANFKVRINATAIILNFENREDFGSHFEIFWSSLLSAAEQSHNLDNYYEYNHRDNLQEQLCLAMAHMLGCARPDDFPALCIPMASRKEIVQNTWLRVINRMVPEKLAPLIACETLLLTHSGIVEPQTLIVPLRLTKDQRSAVSHLSEIFKIQ